LKLFCPNCVKLVDVVDGPRVQCVTGSCRHEIKVRTVRFKDAREGARTCLQNADSLAKSAEILFGNGAREHAFFMVLTAYEEMAKCSRIVDAAAQNYSTQSDMIVEESIFRHHKAKYGIAMHYLDAWIKEMDAIRRAFPDGAAGMDVPDSEGAREEIRQQGSSMREGCLYVEYRNRWIDIPPIPEEKARLHLRMLKQLVSGFINSLASDANWEWTISFPSRSKQDSRILTGLKGGRWQSPSWPSCQHESL